MKLKHILRWLAWGLFAVPFGVLLEALLKKTGEQAEEDDFIHDKLDDVCRCGHSRVEHAFHHINRSCHMCRDASFLRADQIRYDARILDGEPGQCSGFVFDHEAW